MIMLQDMCLTHEFSIQLAFSISLFPVHYKLAVRI